MEKETKIESNHRQIGKRTFIYDLIKKMREKENIEWTNEGAWIGAPKMFNTVKKGEIKK